MRHCGGRGWFGFLLGIGAGAFATKQYIYNKALYGQSRWGQWRDWHNQFHSKYGPWQFSKDDCLKQIIKQKTNMNEDEINSLLRQKKKQKIQKEKLRWKEWKDHIRNQRENYHRKINPKD